MLLRQIKYFIKVIECNSFTEAAEQCYISQSAISQQITSLEKELGVKLLRREGRRFYATAAGEYFYQYGRHLIDEADKLKQETIKLDKLMMKRMRIGCFNGFIMDELYRAIDIFSDSYKDIALEVVSGGHDELYDLLKDDLVDITINDCRRCKSKEVYESLPLVKCKCSVELPRRNELAALPFVTGQQLKNQTCLVLAAEGYEEQERSFYQNVLGVESQIKFIDTMEKGNMLVLLNKGYMLTDDRHLSGGSFFAQVPLYLNGQQAECDYCAFWKVGKAGYISEFSHILQEAFLDKAID